MEILGSGIEKRWCVGVSGGGACSPNYLLAMAQVADVKLAGLAKQMPERRQNAAE